MLRSRPLGTPEELDDAAAWPRRESRPKLLARRGEATRGGERRGEAVTGLGQHGDGSRWNASECC